MTAEAEGGEVVGIATVTSSEEDLPVQQAMSARASAFSIASLMADRGGEGTAAASAVRCCSVESTASSACGPDSDCVSSRGE